MEISKVSHTLPALVASIHIREIRRLSKDIVDALTHSVCGNKNAVPARPHRSLDEALLVVFNGSG